MTYRINCLNIYRQLFIFEIKMKPLVQMMEHKLVLRNRIIIAILYMYHNMDLNLPIKIVTMLIDQRLQNIYHQLKFIQKYLHMINTLLEDDQNQEQKLNIHLLCQKNERLLYQKIIIIYQLLARFMLKMKVLLYH